MLLFKIDAAGIDVVAVNDVATATGVATDVLAANDAATAVSDVANSFAAA